MAEKSEVILVNDIANNDEELKNFVKGKVREQELFHC